MPFTTLINDACATKVSEGFDLIKRNNFPNNRFLQDANPFSSVNSSPGKVIKSVNQRLHSWEVKELMAVSTLVHCMDGWSYLNNSISAFLNGDLPIAIHLAYYTELRAAISFLASEGILVADYKQICLKENDDIYIPNSSKSTHVATWDIMKEWINNRGRFTNALEYFSYKGKTFNELIQFIPNAPTDPNVQLIELKNWIKKWSFDIENYTTDQETRNASSYNPNIKRNHIPISPVERLKNINDFWKSLDPSISAFANIDLYLFSTYLTTIYDNYLVQRVPIPMGKEEYIDLFFESSGLTPDSILKAIFIDDKSNNLMLHAKDSSNDGITGDIKPLSIIARAILLLRFATGACAFHLRSNNINRNDLSFYFDMIGQDCGMWEIGQPDDLKELWDELFLLTDYFDEYLDTDPAPNIYKLRNDLGEYTKYSHIYTQFSRSALWGLGL